MGCQDKRGLGFKDSHKYSTKVILPPFMSMNEKLHNFLKCTEFCSDLLHFSRVIL